jgi:hypothetical protein
VLHGRVGDNVPVSTGALLSVVAEVETHLSEAGWDQPPQLFALVATEQLLAAEPQLAQSLGLLVAHPGSITPIAQDPLGPGPLDEQLASVVFGTEVLGVVLAHEVLVLPPSAEAQSPEEAAAHPDRREVRMVVGVMRDGSRECVLRLRNATGDEDDLLAGPDLAPHLADALLATLEE